MVSEGIGKCRKHRHACRRHDNYVKVTGTARVAIFHGDGTQLKKILSGQIKIQCWRN